MKTYSQKETAAIIRSEIKREFPGHKFSVTCATGSMCSGIRIRWDDGVSERAVEDFIARYSCRTFDSYEDVYRYNTVTYQGEEVRFYGDPDASRTVSTELWQHACNLVGCDYESQFVRGYFDSHERREVLNLVKTTDAAELYAMTPEDYQAAQWEKSEQERVEYERLAAEREAQSKVYAAERAIRDAQVARVQPRSIEDADYRTLAMFAKLNKRNTLGEYRDECTRPDGFHTDEVRVLKVVTLSPADYDVFQDSLMLNLAWLDVGGLGSDWEPTREVGDWHEYTREEQEAYHAQAYRKGMLIKADGRAPFIVDTQGHGYARYVGLASSEKPLEPLELASTSTHRGRSQPKPPGPTAELRAQLEFAQTRHRGLCAAMMDIFASFTAQEHGAAKLADISAQVAAAEREVTDLRTQLRELERPICKPTGGAWHVVGYASPKAAVLLN